MDLSHYRETAALRDGTPVVIRAIRPDDRAALREGFAHLSERTVYHRFFQPRRGLTDAELTYLTELDFHDHLGLIVELAGPGPGRLVGVGRAIRVLRPEGAERAEVAFVVADELQGHGVGTLLLEHLARMARRVGYRGFEAEVLPDNRLMLEVFEHSGLSLRERVVEGVMHVELEL
jgi:GNAT superfamily N-acetyltransferase